MIRRDTQLPESQRSQHRKRMIEYRYSHRSRKGKGEVQTVAICATECEATAYLDTLQHRFRYHGRMSPRRTCPFTSHIHLALPLTLFHAPISISPLRRTQHLRVILRRSSSMRSSSRVMQSFDIIAWAFQCAPGPTDKGRDSRHATTRDAAYDFRVAGRISGGTS